MLHHSVLIRHIAREEEDWMGKVRVWNLHFIHTFEVCWVLANSHSIVLILISPRSSDYSTNLTTSTRKALLLAHVTAGKAVKYTTDRPSLTQPPLGFDSV